MTDTNERVRKALQARIVRMGRPASRNEFELVPRKDDPPLVIGDAVVHVGLFEPASDVLRLIRELWGDEFAGEVAGLLPKLKSISVHMLGRFVPECGNYIEKPRLRLKKGTG
jgi:hypothetical protein